MATLKKYNIQGEEAGELSIADEKLAIECNKQLIKDYLVAILENKRQWCASTKTRAEVKHTTKKPHPQKKTGQARHGDLVAPQFKGGGIAHGPKPKFDQHVRINRKERRKAVRFLMAEKMKQEACAVLDKVELPELKTRLVANFLEKSGCAGKRVLFVLDGESKADMHFDRFMRSARNLPKVEVCLVENLNGYDLARAKQLVCTEKALEQLEWVN